MKGYKYDENEVKALLDKINIVELIGEDMPLSKGEKAFHGECPFDDEKQNMFYVSKNKQSYHCFCCGENGNAISYVMKRDGIKFPQALKLLAQRAGVPEPKPIAKELDFEPEILCKINQEAANYYYKELMKGDNPGYKYISDERKLSDDTIKDFGLGYAKSGRKNLYEHLKAKGYELKDMVLAGLVREDEKHGPSDVYWNRVMFPIVNKEKEVIGFGGRTLDTSKDSKTPKYLNTKETPVFYKKFNLFGINIANNHIENGLIFCEGYMDVIAMHQAGFKNAVASLGTALTPEQVKYAQGLMKYAKVENPTIYLAYDSDDAGKKATINALDIARRFQVNTKVIDLSPCKDPDEFIKANGVDAFKERIADAKDGIIFRIERIAEQYRTRSFDESRQKKKNFYEDIAAVVEDIKTPSEKEKVVNMITSRYGISESHFDVERTDEAMREMEAEELMMRDDFHKMMEEFFVPETIVYSDGDDAR